MPKKPKSKGFVEQLIDSYNKLGKSDKEIVGVIALLVWALPLVRLALIEFFFGFPLAPSASSSHPSFTASCQSPSDLIPIPSESRIRALLERSLLRSLLQFVQDLWPLVVDCLPAADCWYVYRMRFFEVIPCHRLSRRHRGARLIHLWARARFLICARCCLLSLFHLDAKSAPLSHASLASSLRAGFLASINVLSFT